MQLRDNAVLIGGIIWALTACGEVSTLPTSAGVGSNPVLPPPKHKLIPTLNIAPTIGWTLGATPVAPLGMHVAAFAYGLDHPRWLYILPNGDVLVAETNSPPKPQDGKGIKGWIMGLVMKKAGAAAPSANRITLLRDRDGDGKADVQFVLLENLNSPFGMALIGNNLYVANSDAILRFPYTSGELQIKSHSVKLLDLPVGKINHHWTKNLIASADGKKLYVTVGSNSNVAENGSAW